MDSQPIIAYGGPGYFTCKESLGRQKVRMEFFECWNSEFDTQENRTWYISLVVYTKRKNIQRHFDNVEMTGESGAESFVIALRMLQ